MIKAAQNGATPDFVSTQTETLAARLQAMKMTSSKLAGLMGYPLWAIQAIIGGQATITPETAILLNQVLDSSSNIRTDPGYGYQEFLAANPIRPIRNEYLPDFVTPLGETLEETLAAKGMTHTELASLMGYSLSIINEIIAGDAIVTPEIALKLEQAIGVPASFWNNRERRYRESLAKKQIGAVVTGS